MLWNHLTARRNVFVAECFQAIEKVKLTLPDPQHSSSSIRPRCWRCRGRPRTRLRIDLWSFISDPWPLIIDLSNNIFRRSCTLAASPSTATGRRVWTRSCSMWVHTTLIISWNSGNSSRNVFHHFPKLRSISETFNRSEISPQENYSKNFRSCRPTAPSSSSHSAHWPGQCSSRESCCTDSCELLVIDGLGS